MEELYRCSKCGEEISWEGCGVNGGIIYECESECGRYICSNCVRLSEEYEEDRKEYGYDLSQYEKLECLTCKNKRLKEIKKED